jgi:hypothetical protein
MAEPKPICERIRDWKERVTPFWRPYHDAMDEEDAFLDGERYENDENYDNRDRRLIQIRGRELEDSIRHDVATWAAKPRNLQARPIDSQGDPQSADIMLALIEWEQRNPWKGFERELYKAVKAAKEHRVGIVWMDWEPDLGPWGELIYGEDDARRFMWDPSHHPHHPLNAQLLKTFRLNVDEAREKYDAPWLEPDRLAASKRVGRDPYQPLMRGATIGPTGYDDDKVSLDQCWYKNDRTMAYRDTNKSQKLPASDRYMACASGCGYRSPRQSDVQGQLPMSMEQGCPTCGGNLERIDALGVNEPVYAYSRGRRLVIMPAIQKAPDDLPIYDGKWPVPRARSYPALFIFNDWKPGARVFGHSSTSWYWDQQVASDQLLTMMLQRAFEHRTVFSLPDNGLKDSGGRRFEMRDDQRNVAFRDATVEAQWGPVDIRAYSASGVDPIAPTVFGMVQGKINIGRADFGLTPENSKDIAASTVAQLTQQQDLPVADFTRRTREDISMFTAVQSDYVIETYPPQRIARLNIQGSDQILEVWGKDIPGFDFEIEDTPDWTGQEKAQADALNGLMQVWGQTQSPELVQVYAKQMHFAPSVVQSFLEAVQATQDRMKQEQQQQQQQQEEQAGLDMQHGLPVDGMPMPGEMQPTAPGTGPGAGA